MFDSHIHLNDDLLYNDIDKYIEDALNEGVTNFVIIGYDYKSSLRAIDIAKRYSFCYAAIGYHPVDIKGIKNEKEADNLFSLINNKENKVVAIGEIGLDYYWVKEAEERENQKEGFLKQIEISNKYNLPIIIHSRDAIQETYNVLKSTPIKVPVLIHCYNASQEMTKLFIKLGVYYGFGGVITFKNATNLREVIKYVPLNKLLIETDAPYLSPVPYRGKICEPKFIKKTYETIANILNLDVKELEKIVENNSNNFFHVEKYEI